MTMGDGYQAVKFIGIDNAFGLPMHNQFVIVTQQQRKGICE